MMTDAGKNEIRDLLLGSGTKPTHIMIGSGDTAPTASDTQLDYEIPNTREAFSSVVTSDKQIDFEHVMNSAEPSGQMPVYFREIGLSNSPNLNSGDLFCRSTFTELQKTTSMEVQSTITLKIE